MQKKNDIVMFGLHPHTTPESQPIHVLAFGPISKHTVFTVFFLSAVKLLLKLIIASIVLTDQGFRKACTYSLQTPKLEETTNVDAPPNYSPVYLCTFSHTIDFNIL